MQSLLFDCLSALIVSLGLNDTTFTCFYRARGSGIGCYSLILQDSHGAVCELLVPCELMRDDAWKSALHHGDGRVYTFSGLQIGQRTNRARSVLSYTQLDAMIQSTMLFPPQAQFDTQCHCHVVTVYGPHSSCFVIRVKLVDGHVTASRTGMLQASTPLCH